MVDVPNGTSPNRPTIAFDCNNVIYRYGKKSDPVAALANFLDEWVSHGFIVIPVVGGKTQVTKQASIDHIAKREKNKAKAFEKRRDLRTSMSILEKESITSVKRR